MKTCLAFMINVNPCLIYRINAGYVCKKISNDCCIDISEGANPNPATVERTRHQSIAGKTYIQVLCMKIITRAIYCAATAGICISTCWINVLEKTIMNVDIAVDCNDACIEIPYINIV